MSLDSSTVRRRLFPAGFSVMACLSGCASPASQPPPSVTARREVWHDAELLASLEPGRDVLLGAGDSMAPIYGDGTVLVIRPVSFDELREGMTVVYFNAEGRRIAHRLIRHEAGGWRAQGLSNREPDAELVTPQNLVGQLYASLAHEPDGGRTGPAK